MAALAGLASWMITYSEVTEFQDPIHTPHWSIIFDMTYKLKSYLKFPFNHHNYLFSLNSMKVIIHKLQLKFLVEIVRTQSL